MKEISLTCWMIPQRLKLLGHYLANEFHWIFVDQRHIFILDLVRWPMKYVYLQSRQAHTCLRRNTHARYSDPELWRRWNLIYFNVHERRTSTWQTDTVRLHGTTRASESPALHPRARFPTPRPPSLPAPTQFSLASHIRTVYASIRLGSTSLPPVRLVASLRTRMTDSEGWVVKVAIPLVAVAWNATRACEGGARFDKK